MQGFADMNISDLIRAIGDENVGIQNLDKAATEVSSCGISGTTVTFRTDVEALPVYGLDKLGIVVWFDREQIKKTIADNRLRQDMDERIERVRAEYRAAQIDAKFTEREKTVHMGRDPASEAEAMRDGPPAIGDLAYVGRVIVTEGVADVAMDRARVGKALGDGRHRLYAIKPDPAFPIDPELIAAGRLHHSKETTPEALLSRVGDVWDRAGFNSETSDFLRDISDYLSAIVTERCAS